MVRGIATGANEYFVFNQSKATEFSVPERLFTYRVFAKLLTSKNRFLQTKIFKVLKENNRDIFLLNAVDTTNCNVEKYLQKGIEEGIDKRFLTASRSPWYSLENRQTFADLGWEFLIEMD